MTWLFITGGVIVFILYIFNRVFRHVLNSVILFLLKGVHYLILGFIWLFERIDSRYVKGDDEGDGTGNPRKIKKENRTSDIDDEESTVRAFFEKKGIKVTNR